MRIRCLGCAGGYPMGDNGTTSFLVESETGDYRFLLDAGSGSALALEKYLDVSELNAIILTHDHADHSADIGIFQHLLMLKPPTAKYAPVPIYLHPNSLLVPLLMEHDTSTVKHYQPTENLILGDFSIHFLRTVHPIECYAMRIEEKSTGQVLVFTADSGWLDEMSTFAEGATWLIADCAFTNDHGRNGLHMTAEEVARLANEAKVEQLVASHIAPMADARLIMAQIQEKLAGQITLVQCQPGMLME